MPTNYATQVNNKKRGREARVAVRSFAQGWEAQRPSPSPPALPYHDAFPYVIRIVKQAIVRECPQGICATSGVNAMLLFVKLMRQIRQRIKNLRKDLETEAVKTRMRQEVAMETSELYADQELRGH